MYISPSNSCIILSLFLLLSSCSRVLADESVLASKPVGIVCTPKPIRNITKVKALPAKVMIENYSRFFFG